MFLAHKNDLKDNEYLVLDQYNKKKVLVRSNDYKIVSNICPHQKSLISTDNGSGIRVCPYHSWSFDLNGNPIASGRTDYYCKNLNPLEQEQVYEWNNLLFSVPINFDIDVSFKDMVLMNHRVDYVNANYVNIVDLFLDVDHIQSIHNGVYDLVGITNTDVKWKYYNNGSVQTVEQGALWISVYPFTMIEWQKGALFITVCIPESLNKTQVLVYKYADKNYLEDYELNERVWETAWSQDKAQAEIITEFANNNIEPQKIHFRDYLKYYGTNQE